MTNGWRTGRDPILRILRIVSVISFLIIMAIVILDNSRPNDLPLAALLAGAVLLQLGYEVVVPGLDRRFRERRDQKEEEK
jgi:hypothetical protein